ncbi:MAG: antibiotic biosynthesis monooxygenase [Pseudomonadota bacterium]
MTVRVLYRWQVPSEAFEAFKETWRATTNHIHDTVPGAQGSFLLRSSENPTEVLTIAKWDTLESWKKFYGQRNPEAMKAMRELATRISVEAFDEIEDHTR